MTKLIATSVVRGSYQGESHGGVFLVDLEEKQAFQTVDWNKMDIDWQGRGWDRGLRGIEFYDGKIYIAASDEIFVYNPEFELVGSYKNQYLKHCHEICEYRDHLFITSTGFDSLVIFNLKTEEFVSAIHIETNGYKFSAQNFDPNLDTGPIQLNKLHINNIVCNENGMYISGLNTKALLSVNSPKIAVVTTLPAGIHNARPFRDGILFNDTNANAVRYAAPEDEKIFGVPQYQPGQLTHIGLDESNLARQGFGRGLCVVSDTHIAAGSSPSTIALHNMENGETEGLFNLTMDVRNAIHGLEVWPFE